MKVWNVKKLLREGMIVCALLCGAGSYAGINHPSEPVGTTVPTDTLPAAKTLEFNFKQFTIGEQNERPRIPLLRAAPYPTGYVDSTLYRCFTEMPTVVFGPQQKFWQQGGNGGGEGIDRLYGFTVPMVGDLNGDGKPEIVALSLDGTGINYNSPYLYIFNGQTGAVLRKFALPGGGVEHCQSGYHGSPSQIALVNAIGPNRFGEIIVCFNNSSTALYKKQTASFEVTDDNFNLVERWRTTTRYDASGASNESSSGANIYDRPTPQIVDMNGDGVPELIVYNKVYNAATGVGITKFEDLGSSPIAANKTAYVGAGLSFDNHNEHSITFPAIYDIDGDGIYDYIAGGKIYHHINMVTRLYETLTCAGVPDGRTAVADIDGDGKAEVVTHNISRTSGYRMEHTIRVWRPNEEMTAGTLLTTRTFTAYCPAAEGVGSYLYIGDIDGKVQNGKKLPEISLICGRPFAPSTSTTLSGIPVHPNVTDGGVTSSKTLSSTSVAGCLISFTWDNNSGVASNDRLKVSFMLEHDDDSINTGFTLFDFDNDGMADICYRDEQTLRIISARESYVRLDATTANKPNVIRLRKDPCTSYTGYEYPAIADVDGDGSADIIVMGRSNATGTNAAGFILVVEGINRDLAPAPPVWNQFHYHPMKIKADLTMPERVFHPLDPDYAFYKNDTDLEKTFVYNGNIMQTVISSSFEHAVGREIIRPIVLTPDAEVIDAALNVSTKKLTFKVRNIGDASLHPSIPVRIYLNDEANPSIYNQVLGTTLYPGDVKTYEITVVDVAGVYDIIVGGTLVNGNMVPDAILECDWGNNHVEVATFLVREDLATVPHYGTVLIDVFANDILDSPCNNLPLTAANITTPGGPGVLSGTFGSIQIVNNKIMYTAPGPSYGSNLVHFTYKLTCESVTRTADVYIYLLESCQGSFTVCRGVPSYTVCLSEEPAHVEFWWYRSDSTYIGNTFPVLTNPSADTSFYVRPHFGNIPSSDGVWYPFRTKSFPMGRITVKVLGTPLGADTARWTGAVDTDWFNPDNWVQIKNGRPLAMTWAPNGDCVDVILGKDCPHYPELTAETACGNIHLEDRAMIAGIHLLTYGNASIDFEPVSSEKDRFVMWSAPLTHTYTGDYHFPKATNQPDWGSVYMNFFQSGNPDIPGSVAAEKTFTATFGSMGVALPLGRPFNIYIQPDTEGKRFTFPKVATSYTGIGGQPSGVLTRGNPEKFITHGSLSAAGVLALPVDATWSLIQVVNPFAAYLKVAEFLTDNAGNIENSYKIWSGNVDEGFITLLTTGDTMRYIIADAVMPAGTEPLVAPFQSFFVMKRQGASFNTLQMKASMTTTTGPSRGYALRSAPSERGMLRITAHQQSYANATLLRNETGAAAAYDPGEDSRKAFVDGVPVQVYTLTDDRDALAINRSGDFSAPVKLGLRLESTDAPVTLDFSGVADFGRAVYLVDHGQRDREIDLQRQSTYVFTVQPSNVAGATEVNDRFSLYIGAPTGVESVPDDDVHIYAAAGRIHIEDPDGRLAGVTVYDVTGTTVYRGETAGTHLSIPVAPGRIYFVKTQVRGQAQPARKVYVEN
ncbi:MAG: VCBS repeat-containing protein [Tannerella sp.]|jgi:hypothetical protein|nr:VCBS repeat-containing protein [Tannerella sp.]